MVCIGNSKSVALSSNVLIEQLSILHDLRPIDLVNLDVVTELVTINDEMEFKLVMSDAIALDSYIENVSRSIINDLNPVVLIGHNVIHALNKLIELGPTSFDASAIAVFAGVVRATSVGLDGLNREFCDRVFHFVFPF
jgi:hypothetical protein